MLEDLKKWVDKVIKHLELEYGKLQLGRATPSIVEDIHIDSYGSMQPIKNIASINVLDPQTLSIQPWDRTIIGKIAKAITESGIWLNPQTMADSIMIKIPQLTEERRKEIVKVVKKMAEESKVWIRNVRSDIHKAIKKQETDKLISEDEAKDLEEKMQRDISEANKRIDEISKKKETDVMKV